MDLKLGSHFVTLSLTYWATVSFFKIVEKKYPALTTSKRYCKTRIHSMRMHTARLTWAEGYCSGVSAWMPCLSGECLFHGVCCGEGECLPKGVCIGGCLHRGICLEGVCPGGFLPHPFVNRMTNRQV